MEQINLYLENWALVGCLSYENGSVSIAVKRAYPSVLTALRTYMATVRSKGVFGRFSSGRSSGNVASAVHVVKMGQDGFWNCLRRDINQHSRFGGVRLHAVTASVQQDPCQPSSAGAVLQDMLSNYKPGSQISYDPVHVKSKMGYELYRFLERRDINSVLHDNGRLQFKERLCKTSHAPIWRKSDTVACAPADSLGERILDNKKPAWICHPDNDETSDCFDNLENELIPSHPFKKFGIETTQAREYRK